MKMTMIISWIIALLAPLALIGLGLRILLPPLFLKVEYNMPYFPPDDYGFTKADSLKWAPYALNVVAATLGNPLAGLGVAVKKVAEKAKEETGK